MKGYTIRIEEPGKEPRTAETSITKMTELKRTCNALLPRNTKVTVIGK